MEAYAAERDSVITVSGHPAWTAGSSHIRPGYWRLDWKLFLELRIWLPALLFVVINPGAEEGYWRGLLLDAVGNKNKWLAGLYSRTLFMINHMWISVMVIGARNPMASVFQFSVWCFDVHYLPQNPELAMAADRTLLSESLGSYCSRFSESLYSWHAKMRQ